MVTESDLVSGSRTPQRFDADQPDSARTSGWSRPDTIAAVCAALLLALLLRHVIAGEVFFYGDFGQLFEPLRQCVRDSAAHGQLLWNPRLSNGAPMLANPMYGVSYPPNLLGALAPPARGLTVLSIAHLLWGGLGAWLLLRAWNCCKPARWTGAVVFTLAGTTLSSTALINIGWSVSWIPWLLLSHSNLERSRRRLGPLIGLGVTLAAIVILGDPVSTIPAALALVLVEGRRLRVERAIDWRLLAGVALAVALTLPILLPTARLVSVSVRAAGIEPEGVLQWSLHPVHAISLVAPHLFGDPALAGTHGFWAAGLVAPRHHPLFLGMYVGLVVVVLATVGALSRHRMRTPMVAWLVVLLVLTLGRFAPVLPRIAELPGGDSLRYPVKWLAPAVLALALLAALAVDSLARGDPQRRRRFALLGWAALLLVVCGSLLLPAGLDGWFWSVAVDASSTEAPAGVVEHDVISVAEVRRHLLRGAARAVVPLVIVLVLACFSHRRKAGQRLAWLVTAVIAVDLAAANADLLPTVPARAYTDIPPALAAIASDPHLRGRLWVEDRSGIPWRQPPHLKSDYFKWDRAALGGYAAAAFGYDLAFNVDIEALSPFHYAAAGVLASTAPTREKLMFLGAAGVTHIVSFRAYDSPHAESLATIDSRAAHPLRVVRNRLAMPRARVVRGLIPYDGDDGFIAAVLAGSDDLFAHSALVERRRLHRLEPSHIDTGLPSHCSIVADRGSRLEIHTAGGGGYLVVSDTIAPGWRATLDGQPTEIHVADSAFRCVPVPAGDHVVVMTYNPWW